MDLLLSAYSDEKSKTTGKRNRSPDTKLKNTKKKKRFHLPPPDFSSNKIVQIKGEETIKKSPNSFHKTLENSSTTNLILQLQMELNKLTLNSPCLFKNCVENNKSYSSIQKQSKLIRNQLINTLEEQLQLKLSNFEIKFELFGSTASDLFLEDSDIDCNLTSNAKQSNCLSHLQNIILQNFSDSTTQSVLKSDARVPVLQVSNICYMIFNEKENNNDIIYFNIDFTHTTKDDVEMYSHMKQIINWTTKHIQNGKKYNLFLLCKIIKAWVKDKDINSPFRNTLPSLAYLVMIFSTFEYIYDKLIDKKQISYDIKTIDYIIDLCCKNDFDLNENLLGFTLFCIFIRFIDFDSEELIRTVDSVNYDKSSYDQINLLRDSWPDPLQKGFGKMLFIQDPFHDQVNLGRFVTRKTCTKIKKNCNKSVLSMLNTTQEPNSSFCYSNKNFPKLSTLLPNRCLCCSDKFLNK